jgi:hypothetical protein
MANFLLLYSGGSMPETEAGRAEAMQAWGAWFGGLGAATVDAGNPFLPGVKSVHGDGSVSAGPIGSQASGYSVLKADSLDEAVKMAQGCPLLKGGGEISVYETFNAM